MTCPVRLTTDIWHPRPCGRPVEEGQTMCKMHLKAEERRRARNEADDRAHEQHEQNKLNAEQLALQLGAGTPHHSFWPAKTQGYTQHLLLTFDEVEELLRRLK